MSLQYLEQSLIKTRPSVAEKARRPMDFRGDNSGVFFDDSQDHGQESSQYEHYRETYYSAARPIVHRLCSQRVFVAKRGVDDPSRSLSSMVSSGFLPAGEIPSSIIDPSNIQVYDNHPFLRAWEDPNDWQNSFNLKEVVFGSLMATGKGFIVCFVNRGRNPRRRFEFYGIPSTWMSQSRDGERWSIKPPNSDGKPIDVSNDQVCVIKFSDPSNPYGSASRMSLLGKTILTDEAIQAAQYNDFKNPMPKVALIAGDSMGESSYTEGAGTGVRPVRLTSEQRRNIVTWFRQQFSGVQKFGLPIVLDAIIRDIKQISRSPQEMAFLDSAVNIRDRIYEGLGVSPMLNGALEKANRDSALLAEQFFVTNTANPIVDLVTASLTHKFGRLFASPGEDLIIWMAPVIAKDVDFLVELLKIGRLTYSITRNEVRDILRKHFGGLPRIDGWDDVAMPQTMEERDDQTPQLGIGRS